MNTHPSLPRPRCSTSPVLLHDVLKGPEEVLLEAEVGQLSFLQELHGELPQRVHGEDGDVLVGVAAHLEEHTVRVRLTTMSRRKTASNIIWGFGASWEQQAVKTSLIEHVYS